MIKNISLLNMKLKCEIKVQKILKNLVFFLFQRRKFYGGVLS